MNISNHVFLPTSWVGPDDSHPYRNMELFPLVLPSGLNISIFRNLKDTFYSSSNTYPVVDNFQFYSNPLPNSIGSVWGRSFGSPLLPKLNFLVY